jgi:peptidoglycan/xylan/chitin deacetylase (PgdA/CDA1 family)
LASFILNNQVVVHSVLAPKHLIEQAGGFDESLTACEDWDLWLRILKNGGVIKHMPIVGCCYRISGASMSADREKMFLQKAKVIEKVNAWIRFQNGLSEYTKKCLLTANIRLMEEGMARGSELNSILPHTLGSTDTLFRTEKKGIFKLLYGILGAKQYARTMYAAKKFQRPDYEYRLLNEVNLHRYGDAFSRGKNGSCMARVADAVSRWNHQGLILMYHRVTHLVSDPYQINVVPKHFEEHMQVLRKYGKPVMLGETVKNRERFGAGKKEITVTFDDGYADNFINAKPILEKYEIPATFFIVSDGVGRQREFWWDELERIILTPKTLPPMFRMTIESKEYFWYITPKEIKEFFSEIPPNGIVISKIHLCFALWNAISQVSLEEKYACLEQIAVWADHVTPPRPGNLPMGFEELSALAQCSLFEIGAHTRHHSFLSLIPPEKQVEEISGSKEDLEKLLNIPIKTFAYPHGNYSQTTVQLIKNIGFNAAVTSDQAPMRRDSDLFRLPRFNVLDWDGREFESRIASWLK